MHSGVTKPRSLVWKVQRLGFIGLPESKQKPGGQLYNQACGKTMYGFLLRPGVAARRSRRGPEAAGLPLWQPPPEIPRSQTSQQGPVESLRAAQAGRMWRNALLKARMSLCSSAKQGKAEPLMCRVVAGMSSGVGGYSIQHYPHLPSSFLPLTCLRPVVSTQSSISWTALNKY